MMSMNIHEVMPGIHQVSSNIVNYYLVDMGTLILIDAGMSSDSTHLLSYIRENLHRDPSDLSHIILTHYHQDHIGSAREISIITGAQIVIHQADSEYLSGTLTPPKLRGIQGKFIELMMKFRPPVPIQADILAKDGDTIGGLVCIHTPGHTPGSISLYDPTRKVVFAGDAFVTQKGVIKNPPEFANHDLIKALSSVQKLLSYDISAIFVGHGVPITHNAKERLHQFCSREKTEK